MAEKKKKAVVNTLKKKTTKKQPAKKTIAKKPVENKVDKIAENKVDEIQVSIEENNAKEIEEKLENNFAENTDNNIPEKPLNTENQANISLSDFLQIEMQGAEKIHDFNSQEIPKEIPNEPINNNGIENENIVDSEPSFDNEPEDDFSFDDEDTLLDSLFDDYKVLAEFLVEGIDLVAVSGASILAKDFSKYEQYDSLIPESKKAKLKKPLEMLLKQKEVKANPTVVLLGMVLVIYAPVYMKAFEDRKAKKNNEQIKSIDYEPKKRRGRPRGSTNKKKTVANNKGNSK